MKKAQRLNKDAERNSRKRGSGLFTLLTRPVLRNNTQRGEKEKVGYFHPQKWEGPWYRRTRTTFFGPFLPPSLGNTFHSTSQGKLPRKNWPPKGARLVPGDKIKQANHESMHGVNKLSRVSTWAIDTKNKCALHTVLDFSLSSWQFLQGLGTTKSHVFLPVSVSLNSVLFEK